MSSSSEKCTPIIMSDFSSIFKIAVVLQRRDLEDLETVRAHIEKALV